MRADASGGTTKAPRFGPSIVLPSAQGAEPSIAVDTSPRRSRGDIYVGAIGDPNGPDEWHSYNGGRTWSQPVPFDTSGPARGSGEDIVVNTNGKLIATDLDVTWAAVQISPDHGKTFERGTQTAPEDERPWLTAAGHDVYLMYYDFAAGLPVVCASHDGGRTFSGCHEVLGSASNCTGDTVPARRLAIDPTDGSLNLLYSCSTPVNDYYLAQSTDRGRTWTTRPVFDASTAGGAEPSYANTFGTLAIDSAGNYYALFDGTADDANADANPYHVYVVVSRDQGQTWSAPIQVDRDFGGRGTRVLADLAVTRPGNVDVVWYGSGSTGEPDGFPSFSRTDAPAWRVYMAQSRNALAPEPTFRRVVVDPTATHYGGICTDGAACGSSDRSLGDFISVAVDCMGRAHVAYAGNTKSHEAKGQTYVHVSNQTGGTRLAAPGGCH